MASRHLAVLHTALADAMVATWDSKYAHNRPRPAALDPAFEDRVATPASPSYPDEYAVAGAVAAALLGTVFPRAPRHFTGLAEEAGRTRLLAGVSFPSDVAAGTELGHRVAAAALERAARDRSDLPWTGTRPDHAGAVERHQPDHAAGGDLGALAARLARASSARRAPPAHDLARARGGDGGGAELPAHALEQFPGAVLGYRGRRAAQLRILEPKPGGC